MGKAGPGPQQAPQVGSPPRVLAEAAPLGPEGAPGGCGVQSQHAPPLSPIAGPRGQRALCALRQPAPLSAWGPWLQL